MPVPTYSRRLIHLALLLAILLLLPSAALADPPAAPTNLSATPGETIADLTWDVQTGVTFKVYRSTTSGSGYTLIASGIAGASPAFHDTGLSAQSYYYVVSAVAGSPPEESGYSNQASATPTDNPPPAPHDFVVYENGETGWGWGVYEIQWECDGAPDLVGFFINGSWTGSSPFTRINQDPITGSYTYRAAIPKGDLTVKISSIDATDHETMSTETIVVQGGNINFQEPKRHPTYVGGAGSVTVPGGEFVWGIT